MNCGDLGTVCFVFKLNIMWSWIFASETGGHKLNVLIYYMKMTLLSLKYCFYCIDSSSQRLMVFLYVTFHMLHLDPRENVNVNKSALDVWIDLCVCVKPEQGSFCRDTVPLPPAAVRGFCTRFFHCVGVGIHTDWTSTQSCTKTSSLLQTVWSQSETSRICTLTLRPCLCFRWVLSWFFSTWKHSHFFILLNVVSLLCCCVSCSNVGYSYI